MLIRRVSESGCGEVGLGFRIGERVVSKCSWIGIGVYAGVVGGWWTADCGVGGVWRLGGVCVRCAGLGELHVIRRSLLVCCGERDGGGEMRLEILVVLELRDDGGWGSDRRG
ncbi:hypothetical protein Tco_0601660 [Tanacetum coccineum]